MAAIYFDFLKTPSTAALASNATLSYITTTTVLSDPAAIVKHLTSQAKALSRDDKVLNAIQSDNGSCFETETTLKFRAGGGAFLPGIDDNLLDEKTVVLPMVHVVTFDAQQKISQIRLYWEQGTLLKQVEVIGRSGRNWPIRDGKASIDAVTKSLKANGEGQNEAPKSDGTARKVSVSATRDPHASLQLFSNRDANTERSAYDGPSVAPRASARPAPRDYSELFTTDEPSGSTQRSSSPSKIDGRNVKANAGKNFSENRLFDENVPIDTPASPMKKTYGQKYDHFAFGDGEEAQTHQRAASKSSKATAHFSFEDFATPPKANEKPIRPSQSRNWGAGIDEDEPERSPERREVVHRPRPDAEPHFEIADKSPAAPAQKDRTTTNVDNARRGKDFGSQFEIADESPAGAPKEKPKLAPRTELEPHWGFGTPSPAKKIYKTAGDGMGGRGGTRSWGIGFESDPEEDEPESRRSARGRQANAGAQS